MEEVYIIDGEEISLSEIQEAAAASEMEVEEYISIVGGQLKTEEVIEKKEEVVVEDAAPAATEKTAATELPLAGGSLDSPTEIPFSPHPDGDAYYDKLPMMDREKMAYVEWKNSRKQEEVDQVTGLPTQDATVDTKANITIEPEVSNFEEKVDENFKYVSSNPDVYNIILEAEKSNRKEKLVNFKDSELELYFPGRYTSKTISAGGSIETGYYDTKDLDFFGNPKSVDKEEVLKPIYKELNAREGTILKNKLKSDENSYVDLNLEFINDYGNNDIDAYNLNTFYETGEVSPSALDAIEKLENSYKKNGNAGQASDKLYSIFSKDGVIKPEEYLRYKANAGDKSFDSEGNLIGVSFDKGEVVSKLEAGVAGLSQGDVDIVNKKTKELQEKTPTTDVLRASLNKAFFELQAIDNNIAKNSDAVKEDEGGGVVTSILNWFSNSGLTDKAVDKSSEVAKSGFYKDGLKKIMSSHPLAKQHNEKLMEVMSLSRALDLNSNLMTIEEEGLINRYIGTFQKSMTGVNVTSANIGNIGTPSEAAAVYADILRSTGLQVDDNIVQKDVNDSGVDEMTVDVLANITPLLMAIRGSKGVNVKVGKGTSATTYGIKPTLTKLDAITRRFGMGKSPTAKKFYNLANGIVKEVITIGAANEFQDKVFNQEKMPITDAVIFGAGNSTVAGMSKYMATKFIPILSPFARTKMGVVLNSAGKVAAGGASATAIGKSAEAINLGVNYWTSGDEKAYEEGLKHLTDINHVYSDFLAFSFLGMRGEVVTETQNRLLAIDSRTTKTINAAKELGVKEFSTDKEIVDAKNKKLVDQGISPTQSFGKKRSIEEQQVLNKLNLAVETLRTQNNLVEAKTAIEKLTNNQKKTEARLDVIGKKISSGQELNVNEIKEIGKFSDTPLESNPYNFRTPIEALNVVINGKMGNPKTSQEFQNMQTQLGVYSEAMVNANQMFKGESKQIKAKKDLYIGKVLDQRVIGRNNAEIKNKINENPDLEIIYKGQLKENSNKILEIEKEKLDLIKEGLEVEKGEYQSDIDFVSKASAELGINFKELDEKSYIDLANKNGFSNTSEGTYLPKDNTIYINRDAALKNGAVSVASHELGHALTRRAFKNNKGIFTIEGVKAIDSFVENVLSNEQRAKVQERIDKKYNPESKDFREKYYEEYLNVFLDGVKRGEFKMNDTFTQSLQAALRGKTKVDLSTGQGIKNFLDLLNRSGKDGSLDVRIKDFYEASEASVEPLEAEFVKTSESDKRFDKDIDEAIGIERNELGDIQLTKAEWDAGYNKLGIDLVDEGKFDALIIEGTGKNKLKIGSGDIVIEGKGFDRDQYILDVRDKLTDVVRRWNPESIKGEQGGLLGWIANPRNLNMKKLDVFEDYKKIALAEKAARGEYTGAEKGKELVVAPEPFQAGRTNPLDILPSELRAEAIEEVRNNLPQTPEAFQEFLKGKNYKTLKGLANKTTAKFFGVPENKVAIPKDNLSGTEPQRAQMKLAQNKSKFIDIIPRNNVEIYKEYETLDGKRVIDSKTGKEKFKYVSLGDVGTGKATGLPGNIRKALYKSIGRPKGVNNEVFVLKDNLTEADIMKVFGIIDGKKAGDFKLRTPDAQAIKGAMELVSRGIGNKIVRDFALDMGLANEALDLAQGKNVYMASESVTREFPAFAEKEFLINHVGSIAERFSKLPYGEMTSDKVIKDLLVQEFKEGKGYKTFVDPITKSEYRLTNNDLNKLAKRLFQKSELAKEVPFMQKNFEVENKVNRTNIKDFIEAELMEFGFEKAIKKFLVAENISMAKEMDKPTRQETRTRVAEKMWKNQIAEAENKAEWVADNFGLAGQFIDAAKVGGGRAQYYAGITDFLPKFNKAIAESGFKVIKEGSKYFVSKNGKKGKEIERFGKTQNNSEWFLNKINRAGGINKLGEVNYKNPEVKKLVNNSEKFAEKSRKIVEDQMIFMTNEFKNRKIDNIDLALFTLELKSSMGTVLRSAAPLKEIYLTLPGEKRKMKNTGPDGKKQIIWEHSKPAEKVIFELLDVYLKDANLKKVTIADGIERFELNKKGKESLDKVFEGYDVAIIPKAMDDYIGRLGMAEGSREGIDRYYNDLTYGHPEMRATMDLKTGEIRGEAWAIAAEQASNKKLAKVNSLQGEPAFTSKSEKRNNFDYLKDASAQDKAIRIANNPNKEVKKIRVFDFDDTLATSKNIVIAKKEGKTIKLNAEDFAKKGLELKEEGWEMDFSDFNKVTEGGRGPLFDIAERIKNARGNEDLFVLTARAPESREAIYEFLKNEGLEFKKENIIGLGESTGEAKARWLVGKASEGYNDFYFADDAIQNVKAVKEAMSVLDVKSKVQRAMLSESENRSIEFNKILENKSGIEYYKEYSAAKAKTIGATKDKFKFFIPYGAEDYLGLIYPTLGKGKVGDKQMAWYKENVLNPFARANDNLSRDRVQLMADFKELKKELDVPADLRKTNSSGFTNEAAVRVYLFDKTGSEPRGISKTDKAELLDIVNKDPKLKSFAEQLLTVTKGDGYAKPGDNWLVGTITTDLIDLINTTKRTKYLEEWQRNVDEIYSQENMNKLEAIYGTKYRSAMENMLSRMKLGKNRLQGGDGLSNKVLDYINGSNGAIMFFNTRSAVLQTISAVNYLNWGFNNPARAGIAFANQPQYWKDFSKLMNSDFLVDRRNGLRINIAESEVADAASTAKNKTKAVLNYILSKGYLPTQYADSFAIASGGATFYRNRIKDLVKREGKTEKEAEEIAMKEWREVSEESQQSARPDKISQQQSSDAGRLILMFANTPMQYARLQKRAFQDLANGRGDAKTNISKIAYYGVVQNLIFNAMQNALFKMGFDDDDSVDEKAVYRTANGMADGLLRGLGIGGQAVSVGKNFLMDVYERSNRSRPEYVDAAWKLTQFSPPISSKISRIKSAAYPFDNKKMRKEIYEEGFSLKNPALMSGAKVVSATTNLPLDRVLQKYYNIDAALADDAEAWQRIAMLGGWPEWTLQPSKEQVEKQEEFDDFVFDEIDFDEEIDFD